MEEEPFTVLQEHICTRVLHKVKQLALKETLDPSVVQTLEQEWMKNLQASHTMDGQAIVNATSSLGKTIVPGQYVNVDPSSITAVSQKTNTQSSTVLSGLNLYSFDSNDTT